MHWWAPFARSRVTWGVETPNIDALFGLARLFGRTRRAIALKPRVSARYSSRACWRTGLGGLAASPTRHSPRPRA